MYTGHLYDWKGAGVLLETAKQFPISNFQFSKDILFVFVGGTDNDIKNYELRFKNYENIRFEGRKPHGEIPIWLKAADVLVLPNTAKEKISKYYTSPLKLFEYMAAQKPIVASDLPSLREILNENNSVFVKPDDPEALAQGIKKVLQNPELADKISKQAFLDIQDYTWQKRAQKILNFMKK